MNDKLRITLKIADRVYPMNINTSQEENYRKACDDVNKLVRFFEENYKVGDRQDSLAMCAISFALKVIQGNENQNNTNIETQKKLEVFHQLLDEIIRN